MVKSLKAVIKSIRHPLHQSFSLNAKNGKITHHFVLLSFCSSRNGLKWRAIAFNICLLASMAKRIFIIFFARSNQNGGQTKADFYRVMSQIECNRYANLVWISHSLLSLSIFTSLFPSLSFFNNCFLTRTLNLSPSFCISFSFSLV